MKLANYILLAILFFLSASCKNLEDKRDNCFTIQRRIHSFGSANIGDTIALSFNFINNTGSDLAVTSVKVPSSFSTDYKNEYSVHPKESFTLNTRFYPSVLDQGLVDRMIAVRTTSSERLIILHIRGEVMNK